MHRERRVHFDSDAPERFGIFRKIKVCIVGIHAPGKGSVRAKGLLVYKIAPPADSLANQESEGSDIKRLSLIHIFAERKCPSSWIKIRNANSRTAITIVRSVLPAVENRPESDNSDIFSSKSG